MLNIHTSFESNLTCKGAKVIKVIKGAKVIKVIKGAKVIKVSDTWWSLVFL